MSSKIFLTLLVFLELRMICCAKYYEIGIYSNCTDRDNRTQLNIDAGLVSDFNEAMITKVRKSHFEGYILPSNLSEYHVYDVCDNFTLLAEIVQNLILDKKFRIEEKGNNYSYSSIIAFFMYTPLEMTTFVKNMFTQIPVYDIDHRIKEDGSVYNPADTLVKTI